MNQFWVDPEGLSKSGNGYDEVKDHLLTLRSDLSSLIGTYSGSFGGTSEDVKFQRNFLDGIGNYGQGIEGLGNRLGYISEGLVTNGKTYGDSRDSADDTTYQFLTKGEEAGFGKDDQQNPPGQQQPQRFQKGVERDRMLAVERPQKFEKGMTIRGPMLSSRMDKVKEPDHGKEPQRLKPMVKSVRPEFVRSRKGEELPSKPGELRRGMVIRDKMVTPEGEVTEPETGGNGFGLDKIKKETVEVRPPGMFSAIAMPALRKDAPPMVDGKPLGEGQYLIFAKPLPDGSTKLNVDSYSHITPVDTAKVTMGGQPNQFQGDQAFVVTAKPGGGEPLPPDQQLFMDFPPAGKGGPVVYRMSSTNHS
ncbi:hypothetical protein [Saccharopolyspora shandongensis]|uniref:hypothetical protein n=1 Tax=Saccharopolyspora shandongensis TaxID=418495 RepID=UPI0033E6A371